MRHLVLATLLLGSAGSLACNDGIPDDSDTDTDTDTDTEAPVDADGDGFDVTEDCDDDDASVHPDADEVCNGVDDNCDDVVDTDAIDKDVVYLDLDGDSFGDPTTQDEVCPDARLDAHVDNGEDCDDDDAFIHPEAQEVCDEDDVDEDCDGDADDEDDSTDRSTMTNWFVDADGDGFGDPERVTLACDDGPGRVLDNTDCDDSDAEANPELGCAGAWDGTWDGTLKVAITVPDLGLSDTCTSTGSFIVEAGATPELRDDGPWTCTSSVGGSMSVTTSGNFTDEDTIEGQFDADSGTVLLDFTAELDETRGMTSKGSNTETVDGLKILVEHELTATRR